MKKIKSKQKKKTFKILKIFIILILVFVALITFAVMSVAHSPTVPAYLSTVEGNVEVYSNGKWKPAVENQKLKLKDSVKTGSGRAVLVLKESIIVTLDENSEVSIEELTDESVVINQKSGSSWNKFLNALGVASYKVETPNAVATVRGTEFLVSAELIHSLLLVVEGTVEFGDDTSKHTLNKMEKVTYSAEDGLNIVDLTKEDLELILQKTKVLLEELKKLRQHEIDENEFIVNQLLNLYEIEVSEIDEILVKIDRGEIDDQELIDKAPFEIEIADKLKVINDAIKQVMTQVEEIELRLQDEI